MRDLFQSDTAARAADFTIHESDGRFIRLQQLRADAFGALCKLMTCCRNRTAGHHHAS